MTAVPTSGGGRYLIGSLGSHRTPRAGICSPGRIDACDGQAIARVGTRSIHPRLPPLGLLLDLHPLISRNQTALDVADFRRIPQMLSVSF